MEVSKTTWTIEQRLDDIHTAIINHPPSALDYSTGPTMDEKYNLAKVFKEHSEALYILANVQPPRRRDVELDIDVSDRLFNILAYVSEYPYSLIDGDLVTIANDMLAVAGSYGHHGRYSDSVTDVATDERVVNAKGTPYGTITTFNAETTSVVFKEFFDSKL